MPTSAGASSALSDSLSLLFPTIQLGFVLSVHDCAAATSAILQHTRDAGAEWSVVPVPRELVQSLKHYSWDTNAISYQSLTVHFSDATNGWIYGTIPAPDTSTTDGQHRGSRLWSSHGGGNVWRQVHLGPSKTRGHEKLPPPETFRIRISGLLASIRISG